MMKILSHRGQWTTPDEKNTIDSFNRSFSNGFGTETDFRDRSGDLVISHDPPNAHALNADEFFACLASHSHDLPLAINIKADGLQSVIAEHLAKFRIANYFLFDMSVPDAIVSLREGLRVFTRHSDVETVPVLYDASAGVWMDAFADHSWISPGVINAHLDRGKEVCLVSPELHGRDYPDFWSMIRTSSLHQNSRLMLCTDFPEKAQDFFSNEKNKVGNL